MASAEEEKALPRRPASHVLEEQSRRAFRSVLPAEWIIRDVWEDYGVDMSVETYEASLPTGFEFVVQLKAKAKTQQGTPLFVSIPAATVNYLLQRPVPAMIVGYDAGSDALYYRWIEEYLTADEYAQSKKRSRKSFRVTFPTHSKLSRESASEILDYFRPAGVPADRVKDLVTGLSQAGAAERYKILRELRFLRTEDGVLYLLSILPLDALLDNLNMVEASTHATDAFLEVCLNRPTPAATMMFWGVAAHIANAEKNSYSRMAARLFEGMLPKFLRLSPDAVASLSYRLYGYSTEAGLQQMAHHISDRHFSKLAETLCRKLRPMRATKAPRPSASDMFAALYTADMVDNTVVYLTDDEVDSLWRFYDSGREELREMREAPDEMMAHGRGYFKALNQVFGYQFHIEHEASDEDVQRLLRSMAVKKVDLFMKFIEIKEWEDSQDRSKWSEKELMQYAATDMFTYTKVYWYGKALDWFQLPCFCRSFFHGGR